MHENRRFLEFRIHCKEGFIPIPKRLQHQRHLSPKDRIAPASPAKNEASAHVAIDVQGRSIGIVSPFRNHFVAHEPRIPP
jgi:hypothetical protein